MHGAATAVRFRKSMGTSTKHTAVTSVAEYLIESYLPLSANLTELQAIFPVLT